MKRSILTRSFSIVALALALHARAQAQELVTNGGFELGTTTTDFSGWTLSDLSFPIAQNIGRDSNFAHSGSQYANLAGDPGPDSMSQTISTTPGTTYQFSFWLAHDVTPALGNSFNVSWNGTPVLSLSNVGIQSYTNGHYSFDIAATGPLSTISFVYQDNDDFFRLDDVSVLAVPESSTMSLVLMGSGCVASVCYRRRKVSPIT
ncbi:MAG: hypothetical protein M3128_02935 [Verrucomicrobiota bacterium]|nr:hypothetical protein [Verrucomicrobiota bacterium]